MSSNTFRYRRGDANPVKVPWKLNFAVNIGDAVWIDTAETVTPADQASAVYVGKPAGKYTWQTAIADPTTAPTVTAVSATGVGPGFTAASGGFKVAYTYVTPDGIESTQSGLSSAMNTTGDAIEVTGVAAPTGVRWVRWYVTTDGGGASTLKLCGQTDYGNGITLAGPPASDAPAPPSTASLLTALLLTQVGFVKAFAGVSAQFYDGTATTSTTLPYGVKRGYFRVDTSGVFDFACAASSNFNEGDLVGLAKDTGNSLDPQTVVAVSYNIAAIGHVEQAATSTSTVRVKIASSKYQLPRPSYLTV